jgi:predicted Zn-dependent peptidase
LLLVSVAPARAQDLEGKVVEHTLKNGMKFLLVRRPEAPVFSAVINFRVGGVDNPSGKTGLAHMFEHMAFKGTEVIGTRNYAAEIPIMKRADEAAENLRRYVATPHPDPAKAAQLRQTLAKIEGEAEKYIVKDELTKIYLENGANQEDLNAQTSVDMTSYINSLPSNRFELWALIESQRMADPVLREFYSERDVVAEERRRSTESDPGGLLYEATKSAAYEAHPYHYPTIGWMSDIQSLTRPMALEFRKTYYVPNNAVGAVVGDIDPAQAIPILDKYFGSIPKGPTPPPVTTKEPVQQGKREAVVEFDAQPQVLMMYHKPTMPDYDDFVFDVIDALLSSGRTSRLYTALVKEKQIAAAVNTYTGDPGARYPNLFDVEILPRYPHTAKEVEDAAVQEIDRLKNEPIPAEELQKVKNKLEADFVYGLQSDMGLASQLGYFQTIAGDWRYLLRWRTTMQKITADDVQRAAKKYLTNQNLTVGEIAPLQKASDNAGGAGQPGGPS